MSFETKEEFLKQLGETLQDFKTPFLNSLDDMKDSETEDLQSTERINTILKEFDTLRGILEREIRAVMQAGQQVGGGVPTLDEKLVLAVFQQRGFLTALREHPDWAEDALYTVRLFLQTYPFTPSPQHIRKLEKGNVTSHVREIVPNQE
jgi:hypothetical protein